MSGALFHYARLPAYWGTMSRIARALDLRENERLLDLGCGTGVGAGLAGGQYVGIDTGLAELHFAARRLPRSGSVAAMGALALGFVNGAFDRAVAINMVHHLDDQTIDQLLAQLTRVVRKRVVIADAAPEYANRLETLLFRYDRGAHIRTAGALRALPSHHYNVEHEEIFHNTLHTVSQILFVLTPR